MGLIHDDLIIDGRLIRFRTNIPQIIQVKRSRRLPLLIVNSRFIVLYKLGVHEALQCNVLPCRVTNQCYHIVDLSSIYAIYDPKTDKLTFHVHFNITAKYLLKGS